MFFISALLSNEKVILPVFQRIYLIGSTDYVFKERQYKGYCLISNKNDSWKCVLDHLNENAPPLLNKLKRNDNFLPLSLIFTFINLIYISMIISHKYFLKLVIQVFPKENQFKVKKKKIFGKWIIEKWKSEIIIKLKMKIFNFPFLSLNIQI